MSTQGTAHIARQPAGSPDGGKFAAKPGGSEANLTLDDGIPQSIIDELDLMDPYEFDLAFVDRDDQLQESQIIQILAGDPDEAADEVLEAFVDQRWRRAGEIAADIERKTGITCPDHYELIENIVERDTSDPYGDCLKVTPAQLMRVPLTGGLSGDLVEMSDNRHLYDDSYMDEEAARAVQKNRADRLSEILSNHTDHDTVAANREAIEELVANGPDVWHEGVQFDVIYHGDVVDVIPGVKAKAVAFDAPHLVLLDTINGSGHSTQMAGPLETRIDALDAPNPSRAVLDSPRGGHGYGWDDTAGVVKSAFAVDVSTRELDDGPSTGN